MIWRCSVYPKPVSGHLYTIMKITTFILFLCNICIVNSQSTLLPFEKNDLWGYKNTNHTIIVNPIFDEAYAIFFERGRVKINGKFGYINCKGKVVIKPSFEFAEDFIFGVAEVKVKNKKFYINRNGKKLKSSGLISCVHTHLDSPYLIQDSLSLGIFKSIYEKTIAKLLLSEVDSLYLIGQILIARKNNKFAVYDLMIRDTTPIAHIRKTEFKYDSIKFFKCNDNDGKLQENIALKENSFWGMILLNFKNEIIEPKYLYISGINGHYALVEFENGNFGYIDIYGKEYFYRNENFNGH